MWISNIAFFYKWSKISNIRRWQSWKSIFRDFGWHCKNVMNKTKLCKLLQLLLIEGILHFPRCIKPYKQWDKLPTSTNARCLSSTALAIHGLSSLLQGLSSRGLRFVVHRGTEGFGDRLQQLLMAMRYARATGRALVIDWRDAKCLGPKLPQAVLCFFFCWVRHSFWKKWSHGVCDGWFADFICMEFWRGDRYHNIQIDVGLLWQVELLNDHWNFGWCKPHC